MIGDHFNYQTNFLNLEVKHMNELCKDQKSTFIHLQGDQRRVRKRQGKDVETWLTSYITKYFLLVFLLFLFPFICLDSYISCYLFSSFPFSSVPSNAWFLWYCSRQHVSLPFSVTRREKKKKRRRIKCFILFYEIPASDETLKPFSLTSHWDVVPVEEDKWSVPAFQGLLKGGFINGRGTLESEEMAARDVFVHCFC